ncbi:MAG: type II secretion system F family protein [Verrucomicrobia bacterium]|nr:type II secretion system F family protein [Verrucomicrobiota bacterium]
MPTYAYKAKAGPERTVEGELLADSRQAALATLDGMGLIPIVVEEALARTSGNSARKKRRVSRRDVTLLTRQLASLTKSGVPILRSLRTIRDQSTNTGLERMMEDFELTVRDGNMLSDAFQKYPTLFSPLYLDMVRAGESGGVLDATLTSLAAAREKEDDMRRKVQAAMAYPMLVLIVGLVTVFLLLSFFMPRVFELFESYHFGDLPWPTKVLLAISAFCESSWHWIVIMGLLVGAVVSRMLAKDKGRSILDAMVLRIPMVRTFVTYSEIARFARTLALLIESGVQIDKGLELSANTMANDALRQEVHAIRHNTVQRGAPLSSGLHVARYFPPFVANMVGVGEEAGRLDEALNEIASFYEKEVDQLTQVATSLIEPILILTVGAFVGFIVAAMLLPIFQMGTGL